MISGDSVELIFEQNHLMISQSELSCAPPYHLLGLEADEVIMDEGAGN